MLVKMFKYICMLILKKYLNLIIFLSIFKINQILFLRYSYSGVIIFCFSKKKNVVAKGGNQKKKKNKILIITHLHSFVYLI